MSSCEIDKEAGVPSNSPAIPLPTVKIPLPAGSANLESNH
jgi:hypothetical protein